MSKRQYKLIPKSDKWKSVSIQSDEGFIDKDFDGLVSIEELDDYQCVEGLVNKRAKKRKNSFADNESDNEEEIVKKKKSKKWKKSKKSFETQNKEELDCEETIDSQELTKSMSLWKDLSVAEPLLKALYEMSFTKPTPIQCLAIPSAIIDGMDIIGAAETGSGKTLAFGIPLISSIINDKLKDTSKRLHSLVLTPTRELAIQVKKHMEAVAKYSGVTIGVIVGGMSVQKQERVLNKLRPDIVVATPGRLWELIEDNSSPHLEVSSVSQMKYIVIDEADRMTERGHFEELRKIIDLFRRGQTQVKGRQTFVFSATLTLDHILPKRLSLKRKKKKNKGKSGESKKLSTLIDILGLNENKTKVIDLTRGGVGTPDEELLTETKLNCLQNEKDLYLYYFICSFPGRTIIFCNSKDCLRRLVNVLKLLQLNPLPLHASMPQKRRLTNLEKFESNPKSLLIASDVAARGLDIANIDHVVHYQIPRTAEIYIHRSGRTARAFNRGLSLMLCEPKEEAQYYKQLCHTVNKGRDLQTFPVDQSVLKSLKQRIDLAKKCDQLEHKVRKEKANSNWFKNNAIKCDIYTDEDSTDSDLDNDCEDKHSETRKLNSMTKQLNFLLKKSLLTNKSIYAHLLNNKPNSWT